MITVKKDAIKFRNSEGNMQSAGVLCEVGVMNGCEWVDYIRSTQSMFVGVEFPDGYELELNLPNVDMENASNKAVILSSAFAYTTGIKKVKLILNYSSEWVFNIGYMFRSSSSLEEVDFLWNEINLKNATWCFDSCKKLKVIKAYLNFSAHSSSANNYTFYNCSALEEVRIVSNTIFKSINFAQSPLLSDESIQSIIDGLATVETSQTLTFHADVKAKLTEEQISQITSKNWTLA